LTSAVDRLVAEAEEKIDAYLKANYQGLSITVELPSTVMGNSVVQDRLKASYAAVGWAVVIDIFYGDCREDGSIHMTLSPISQGQKK
jgi:hypothetical protein